MDTAALKELTLARRSRASSVTFRWIGTDGEPWLRLMEAAEALLEKRGAPAIPRMNINAYVRVSLE